VFRSTPELEGFAEMLGGNAVDDFKKIVAAAMKPTNSLTTFRRVSTRLCGLSPEFPARWTG
jgi:hypothetical protein